MQLGLPEAQLPLAQAAVLIATAPKSNSVSAGSRLDLLGRLAGVACHDLVQILLDPQEMLHIDLHVRDLALRSGRGLMDHDLGIGQGNALALGAGGQQERAHGCGHAHADGGHIALDVLHGVIDGHAVRHGTAGAVDIQLDVLVRVLCLQIQQLRHHQTGRGGIDLLAQKDDAVIQQAGEDVVGPLAAVGLLHNIRD